jgi:hypothetical protein
MQHQSLSQELHTVRFVFGLLTKASMDCYVLVFVSPAKKLIDLRSNFVRIEALFNNIRREFELTQSHEVLSDYSKDHVALLRIFEL